MKLKLFLAGLACLMALGSAPAHAVDNPILADGKHYTTDPAPLVADGKFYILTGRDTAPVGVNDFIMPEWQLLETDDPTSGVWKHTPHFVRPEDVFKWATPARAYAAQMVKGPDGRFYLYAPVVQKSTTARDAFGIGVAVADQPQGPWTDAHPAGPIVSQTYPLANDIQNIDPTVLVDDDGRIYLYWGTFGRLKGVELERDMVTFKGRPVDVSSLTGFFEAPWIFKRKGAYYMIYAGNEAGPDSECTEAVYYACQAYGTAPSPLGPWTYRGVLLDPVSSTTSHAGIVQFKDRWFIAYHNADAVGGDHFRRSVSLDEVTFDDSTTPALINMVEPTRPPAPPAKPQRNIAAAARIVASNSPVPVQYWIRALNDGKVHENPLPPDVWGTWTPNNPAQQWVVYQWEDPVRLNGARIRFWNDQPAGSGVGVAAPKAWHLEYWNEKAWAPVVATSAYGVSTEAFNDVAFDPVQTRCLRAVFDASTDGKSFAAVAAQELEALYPTPVLVEPADTPIPASANCAIGTQAAAAAQPSMAAASSAMPVRLTVTQSANLRELAGPGEVKAAAYEFTVPKGVVIAGKPGGGVGIDTGVWPAGVTLTLTIKGHVYGGGGKGGQGGDVPGATDGGRGGDALYIQTPLTLVIDAGASIKAGGGGGAGANGGGSGGGGGFPNGERGEGGAAAFDSNYDTALGGPGRPGTPGGGGMGGQRGAAGASGGNAGMPGGSATRFGGPAGRAIVTNGYEVKLTRRGAIFGDVL